MRGAGSRPSAAAGGKGAGHAKGRGYGKGGGSASGAQSAAAPTAAEAQQLAALAEYFSGWHGGDREVPGYSSPRRPAHGAAAASPSGAAEAIYEYSLLPRRARRASDLAGASGVQSASEGTHHSAVVISEGEVLCAGRNHYGELGAGNYMPHKGLRAAYLPWPAASVRCGLGFSVAVGHGGVAVYSWGMCGPRLGRYGHGDYPAEVEGLPLGDPVTLLEAGVDFAMALTASGNAFVWGGAPFHMPLQDGVYSTAVRIASLSGRGVVRLACGMRSSIAETKGRELLFWTIGKEARPVLLPPPQPGARSVAFPLRSMAAGGWYFALADARGGVWHFTEGSCPKRACLPERTRAVRVAAASSFGGSTSIIIALTDRGELWDCSELEACRSINAAQPDLPLGLMLYGGAAAERILLIPDICGGLARLRLFALIAVRRWLPLHLGLVGFMVDSCYLIGPKMGPFSLPTGKAAAPSAES